MSEKLREQAAETMDTLMTWPDSFEVEQLLDQLEKNGKITREQYCLMEPIIYGYAGDCARAGFAAGFKAGLNPTLLVFEQV